MRCTQCVELVQFPPRSSSAEDAKRCCSFEGLMLPQDMLVMKEVVPLAPMVFSVLQCLIPSRVDQDMRAHGRPRLGWRRQSAVAWSAPPSTAIGVPKPTAECGPHPDWNSPLAGPTQKTLSTWRQATALAAAQWPAPIRGTAWNHFLVACVLSCFDSLMRHPNTRFLANLYCGMAAEVQGHISSNDNMANTHADPIMQADSVLGPSDEPADWDSATLVWFRRLQYRRLLCSTC